MQGNFSNKKDNIAQINNEIEQLEGEITDYLSNNPGLSEAAWIDLHRIMARLNEKYA